MANNNISTLKLTEVLSIIIALATFLFIDNKIVPLWITFFTMLVVLGYNFYQNNREIFNSKDRETRQRAVYFIMHRLAFIGIAGYLINTVFIILTFPDRFASTTVLIIFLLFAFGITFKTAKLTLPKDNLRLPWENVAVLIFIFLISLICWILRDVVDWRWIKFLSYILLMWKIGIVIGMLIVIDFLAVIYYNVILKAKNKFKFSFRKLISGCVIVLFIFTTIGFMFLVPNSDKPISEKKTNCFIEKVYSPDGKDKLTPDLYAYSIPYRDYENISVIFKGILQMDGAYVEVPLLTLENMSLKDYNKTYWQYVQVMPLMDQTFKFLAFRFYINRVELLEGFEILTTERVDNCPLKEEYVRDEI